MTMELKCLSCGAINSIESKNNFFTCEFCKTQNSIDDDDIDNIEESHLSRAYINDGKINFTEENVKSISDIVKLYKKYEIKEKINSITIRHNPIEDLSGISIFKLWYLDMSDNNLKIINELPSFEGQVISLNYSNNPNLIGFTSDCIDKLNTLKDKFSIRIYLMNCDQFEFENFLKINFEGILESVENYEDDDFPKRPGRFEIVTSKSMIFPEYLIKLGFKKKEFSYIFEGKSSKIKRPKKPKGCSDYIANAILYIVLAVVLGIILLFIKS